MRDSVADALRQALLDCRFNPGEALVESQLAAEMKVSRGPVREALLVLMQEGLVSHSQNRGFAVLNFSEADQRATDQVRYPLETLALQLARLAISDAEIDALEQIADRMSEQFRQGDIRGRLASEIEFHGSIWKLSGNPWLCSCLQRVVIPAFTYGAAYRMNRPDLNVELFREQHRMYIDYLRGHREHSAAACVRYHLDITSPDGKDVVEQGALAI